MKYILLKVFLIVSVYGFSQIIDQQVIPYPRLDNNTKLIIKSSWATQTCNADSFDVIVSGTYNDTILIHGYYVNSPWQQPCIAIDTIDLSNYVIEQGYFIKFIMILRHELIDTFYLPLDSITHRIAVESSSKVETINNKYFVKIYPNPSSKEINIIGKNMQEIELINESGQLIEQYNVNSDKFVINVANRNKGIYFVKVETINGSSIEKIVVN